MNAFKSLLTRLVKDEEGAALVEYGLLVALIALVCIIAVTAVGTGVNNTFSNIAGQLP